MATKHFRERLEDAILGFLAAAAIMEAEPVTSISFEARSSADGDEELPLCTVACVQAAVLIPDAYLYRADVSITLRTSLDVDGVADHSQRVAWLEDQLDDCSAVVAAVSAASGLTGQSITLASMASADADGVRSDTIMLTVICHSF